MQKVIQKYGLTGDYKTKNEVGIWFQLTFGLVFVEPVDVFNILFMN